MKWPFSRKQETIFLTPICFISVISGLIDNFNSMITMYSFLSFSVSWVRISELYFIDCFTLLEYGSASFMWTLHHLFACFPSRNYCNYYFYGSRMSFKLASFEVLRKIYNHLLGENKQ